MPAGSASLSSSWSAWALAAWAAIATTPEIDGWYTTIEKPAWNPPDYIFGPVWTTLFLMMAIAGWLVWQRAGVRDAAMALTLYLAWVSFASLLNFAIWRMNSV